MANKFMHRNLGGTPRIIRCGLALGFLGVSVISGTAVFAAALDTIRLASNVVPAPFGYEAAAPQYVVTETTPLYISPFIYPGTVNNDKLKPGQSVTALAKAKDADWILVGKDGLGIGYIPVSRLAPAKR